MEYDLFFENPVFHNGLNVTVRRGHSWLKAVSGDTLVLKDADAHIHARADTHSANHKRFKDIDTDEYCYLLRYMHDPRCRTYQGLLDEMGRIYPDFSENEFVTLLLFFVENL